MIYLIIKSYLSMLLSVASASLLLLIGGLYLIFRRPKHAKTIAQPAFVQTDIVLSDVSSEVIDAIAGDDHIETQLDLARAYIEAGKANMAKKILTHIISQGSAAKRQEAEQLLGLV